MAEADFSNKSLGMGGATIISAWITHRDKGALSELIFGGGRYYDSETGESINHP
jgi:predicted acetyltransferase